MMKSAKTMMLLAAAFASGAAGLFWSGNLTPSAKSGLVTEAQAIIGRPLTPESHGVQ